MWIDFTAKELRAQKTKDRKICLKMYVKILGFKIKSILFQTRFKNRFWNLFPGEALVATWHSTTPPVKALSHDRLYYFLPYWDEKPTIYIRSTFPDHRKRMYNSNSIGRIADKVVSSELFWIQIWAVQWSLSLRILVFKTGAQWAILYQVNAIMTMLMS